MAKEEGEVTFASTFVIDIENDHKLCCKETKIGNVSDTKWKRENSIFQKSWEIEMRSKL